VGARQRRFAQPYTALAWSTPRPSWWGARRASVEPRTTGPWHRGEVANESPRSARAVRGSRPAQARAPHHAGCGDSRRGGRRAQARRHRTPFLTRWSLNRWARACGAIPAVHTTCHPRASGEPVSAG